MTIEKFPLGIDLHVHFREPGNENKETLNTGYEAAISGGIGTVLDMPNTRPPVDSVELYKAKQEKLEKYKFIYQAAAITSKNIEDEELSKLGRISPFFKVFMANSTGDLGVNLDIIDKGFELLEPFNSHIIVHAELPEYIQPRRKDLADRVVRPEVAEVHAIRRVIEFQDKFPELQFHVTHVSTYDGALLLLDSETKILWDCLHKHLMFDDTTVEKYGNYARMNPPLREKKSVDGLRSLFSEGKIPIITSDHAPHTHHDKELLVAGAPGVQELYYFMIDHYLKDFINKRILIDMIYDNPGKILENNKLHHRKGEILVSTEENTKFTLDQIKSKSGWSLWEDYEFRGKIIDIDL